MPASAKSPDSGGRRGSPALLAATVLGSVLVVLSAVGYGLGALGLEALGGNLIPASLLVWVAGAVLVLAGAPKLIRGHRTRLGCASLALCAVAPVVVVWDNLPRDLFRVSTERLLGDCDDNLRTIGQALLKYRADYGCFPTTGTQGDSIGSLMLLHPKYLREPFDLLCRGDKVTRVPERPHHVGPAAWKDGCSYSYDGSARSGAPPDHMMVWDKSAAFHLGSRFVLFADGSVELLPEEEFQRRLAQQRLAHRPGE